MSSPRPELGTLSLLDGCPSVQAVLQEGEREWAPHGGLVHARCGICTREGLRGRTGSDVGDLSLILLGSGWQKA